MAKKMLMTRKIVEILFSKDEVGTDIGLCYTDDGECSVNMYFQDGYAIEVDEDGNHVRPEQNPLILLYPSIKVVKASKMMLEEIESYTGRPVECVSDIALKYGILHRFNDLVPEWKHQLKEDFLPEKLQWYIRCCPNYMLQHPEIEAQIQQFFMHTMLI